MGSDTSNRPSRIKAGRIFRSVRFKIILLLLVSLVSLSTLWAFAASITLGDGLNLLHVQTIQDHVEYPSGSLGSALEQERRLSMVFLGSKSPGDRASMESARLVTDRAGQEFRRLASNAGAQKVINPQARQWTQEIITYLDGLPLQRRTIDHLQMSRPEAFSRYSGAISTVNALQSSLSTLSDSEVTRDAKTQVTLARAREVLSQEDALLSGALAAGRLTFTEHVEFTKLVGTQRTMYAQTVPDLRDDDRAFYQQITSTPEYTRLQTLENRFTDHMPATGKPARAPMPGAGGMPVDATINADTAVEWKTTVSSVLTRLRGLELSSTAEASKRAKPIATGIITRVILAGALGLLAVLASLALSVWVGRSVIRELNGLRRAALDLANERLPAVIRRLRRGENVDVAAEAPPLSFGTDEIDQVGQAFNAARRTAIQGAVEEATLRKSIGEVFLNLARRNQALLHRQLSLLDTMERRISEPDELEDLFRLDHLATRMRRHAEGLIILSGQAPGRGWRNPVRAVDVARAAAAEVEDYARVTVTTMPRVSIAGPVVADLIHLLAELIENATLFSPPDTTVQVSGQTAAHGFAIEVEDRGLSMDPASLADANERLAHPPDFDLSSSAQLGLFVVGRLAQRHSIQVTLRKSPYGGTTAIVLLADAMVVRSGDQPELASGQRLAVTRRGEDALVPIGAIGSPPPGGDYANGTAETGPMPIAGGERPPLPQRRNDAEPGGFETPGPYDARPYDPTPYDATPYDATPYDTTPPQTHGSYDTGQYDTGSYAAGSYDTGSFGAVGYDQGGAAPGFGANAFDAGRLGDLGQDGPDTGQWQQPAPDRGEDRPPLPQRRSDDAPEGRSGLPQRQSAPEPAPRRSVFEPSEGHDTTPAAEPVREQAPPAGEQAGRPLLPRRVRQASLAPQLREEVEPIADTSGERSPEELRTMLSSIQKGWLRGRSEAERNADHEQEDI